jgi:adenosylhomocysteine nucleosidase
MIILFAMAMKMELIYLLKHFPGISEYKLGEYIYYQTKFQEKIIYFLLTGVGSLNTAISISKFLSKIKPDIIINAGTSGGHDKKLNVGDIILAKEVIYMNSVETLYKEENEGSNSLTWKLITFTEDNTKDYIGAVKLYYADEQLLSIIKSIGEKYKMTMYEGRIASGDIWNKEKDRINFLHDKYLTSCEEMEIYSVYSICHQEKIPCMGIKIISNNEMNGQSYDLNVTEKLDEFLYKIILELEHK